MKFFERIKQARIDANLTQIDVSQLFSKFGHSVKPYAISSWETGKHKPDLKQFAVLCKIYKADAMYLLTGKNDNCESILYGLNQKGRAHVTKYIDLLKSDSIFTQDPEVKEVEEVKQAREINTFRLYDIPVSAGTGMYLDSDNYEEITADELIPKNIDYAVRVSGDSMEPKFSDGQIIFIRKQETLNDGEIGIFSLNGEAYVKQLFSGTLVSINPKYKPIQLCESDNFRVFGKVIE